ARVEVREQSDGPDRFRPNADRLGAMPRTTRATTPLGSKNGDRRLDATQGFGVPAHLSFPECEATNALPFLRTAIRKMKVLTDRQMTAIDACRRPSGGFTTLASPLVSRLTPSAPRRRPTCSTRTLPSTSWRGCWATRTRGPRGSTTVGRRG